MGVQRRQLSTAQGPTLFMWGGTADRDYANTHTHTSKERKMCVHLSQRFSQLIHIVNNIFLWRICIPITLMSCMQYLCFVLMYSCTLIILMDSYKSCPCKQPTPVSGNSLICYLSVYRISLSSLSVHCYEHVGLGWNTNRK